MGNMQVIMLGGGNKTGGIIMCVSLHYNARGEA